MHTTLNKISSPNFDTCDIIWDWES